MLCCSPSIDKSVPQEYREVAEALFPSKITGPRRPLKPAILAFAQALGVEADYRKLDASMELKTYLLSFQNNLDLLIRKTWVEKADEDRKEKLLNRISGFISLIERGFYAEALEEFSSVLDELAWLLFGPQCRREDFFEYAFRIDYQMGLFWWYGGQLDHFLASGAGDRETLRAVLLLGICYLTDF
ncbi:MAG: hypothetical protein LBO65_01330 [Spirochaetaceae bacterium]|jgi:hypothetical protein|nr:hypothetical protein [Spirochaetaceae bacterium]